MEDIFDNIVRSQGFTNYLFLFTAIVGVIQFKKFKEISIRCFIIAFAYLALSDYLSLFYGRTVGGGSNSIVFNISYIVSFTALFYVFHAHIENKYFRAFIKIMFGVYVLLVFIDIFFLKIDYNIEYQAWPYVIGGITVLLSVLFYFYEVLNSEKLIALERNMIFWIAFGHFFYFLAKVPLVVRKNLYVSDSSYHPLLITLNEVMTMILCVSLIIGFLWSRPRLKN